jgi:hypothetical protein
VRWQVSAKMIRRTLQRMAKTRYQAWMLTEDIWSVPAMSPTPDIDTSVF